MAFVSRGEFHSHRLVFIYYFHCGGRVKRVQQWTNCGVEKAFVCPLEKSLRYGTKTVIEKSNKAGGFYCRFNIRSFRI